MMTYDPNVDSLSSPIPPSEEMPINEQLARQPEPSTKTVPQGLLKVFQQEKNVDESQMADFSTPIEEVLQNEVMGPAYGGPGDVQQQAGPSARIAGAPQKKSAGASKNPFGLTDEQFQAALAGAAAVVAFSKPVQERLRSMVPKFVGDSGDVSLTGLAVTALVAAVVFYILKKFIAERA
jgi:hypothetical protein